MWTDCIVNLLRTKKRDLRKIGLSIANVNILIVVTCTFCILNKTHGRLPSLYDCCFTHTYKYSMLVSK